MWKRSSILCALVVLAMTTSSCLFDPEPAPPKVIVPAKPYENLTEKWHVLNNLEKAYNDRSIDRYKQVLDEDFVFFLAPGDVGGPGNIPAQWLRLDEIQQTERLFDRVRNEQWPYCKSIVMDVLFEGILQWEEVTPGSAPDETWYSAVVFYEFTIQIEPDVTYIPVPGAKAKFTVRNAGTEVAPKWQLVEWEDFGAQN